VPDEAGLVWRDAARGNGVRHAAGRLRYPSFRDLAGESHAVFAPPGDPDAWGEAVNALIDDTARREMMMQAGRKVAERHAWPLVAQRVLAVYRRVTG